MSFFHDAARNQKGLRFQSSSSVLYLRRLFGWIVFSLLLGALLGVIGSCFVSLIEKGIHLREQHPWILLLMPVGGLLIVWLYKVTRNHDDRGTNMVIASLRSEAELPVQMAPLIFLSTIITHTCGGSAGREGAALQLGGSIGNLMGKLLKIRKQDKQLLILCGMSAAFSAIFRTPVAAVIFVMEVECIGEMWYTALAPCAVSSLTASYIASQLGHPLAHHEVLGIPELTPVTALQMLLLGIVCAMLSRLFCTVLHRTEAIFEHRIRNPYLRIIAASAILLALGMLVRSGDFYGLGEASIHAAIAGEAVWYAFLLKILFTAVTLAGGFKGGEIVPCFFVGATFGCVFGHLIGLSPSLCAAAGMVAMFCSVTNCPLASLLIAAELFGMECLPFCLIVICISNTLSGNQGLYSEQRFHYSKFSDKHITHKAREQEKVC